MAEIDLEISANTIAQVQSLRGGKTEEVIPDDVAIESDEDLTEAYLNGELSRDDLKKLSGDQLKEVKKGVRGQLISLQSEGSEDGRSRELVKELQEEELRRKIKEIGGAISGLEENLGEAGGIRSTMVSLNIKLGEVKGKIGSLTAPSSIAKLSSQEKEESSNDIQNEEEMLKEKIVDNRRKLVELNGREAIEEFLGQINQVQQQEGSVQEQDDNMVDVSISSESGADTMEMSTTMLVQLVKGAQNIAGASVSLEMGDDDKVESVNVDLDGEVVSNDNLIESIIRGEDPTGESTDRNNFAGLKSSIIGGADPVENPGEGYPTPYTPSQGQNNSQTIGQ